MPEWPNATTSTLSGNLPSTSARRWFAEAITIAAMSLTVGAGGTVLSVYLSLRSVEGRQIDLQKPDLVIDGPDGVGPLPEVGRLHVREGVFWEVASDRLPGVWWIHVERLGQPSINPSLDLPIIPAWADPPRSMWQDVGAKGEPAAARSAQAAVGTLAVGWPWLAVAQQWIEEDRPTGFIPTIVNDDDGSTTARAADRFGTTTAAGRPFILWAGCLADTALFGLVAAPVFAFLRRRSRRHSAGR